MNETLPVSAKRRGSKWVGICLLWLVGGIIAIASGGPGRIPGLGAALAIVSLALGIYSFFRIGVLALGFAAAALVCGMACAAHFFLVSCIGDCAFVYSPRVVIICVILPSAIASVAGLRARVHPGDSPPAASGSKAVLSLVLGLTFWLPLGISGNMDIGSSMVLISSALMWTASVAGLSLGVDAVASPRRGLGIAGVVLNIIGVVLSGSFLPMSLAGHAYSRGGTWHW